MERQKKILRDEKSATWKYNAVARETLRSRVASLRAAARVQTQETSIRRVQQKLDLHFYVNVDKAMIQLTETFEGANYRMCQRRDEVVWPV